MTHDQMIHDGWIISRRGSSDVEETLFALADGCLGIRASLEERRSTTAGVYMAGVFERTPIFYHERLAGFADATDTRVPVADGLNFQVIANGCLLGSASTQLASCDWQLQMRAGVVTRVSRWDTPSGALEVRAERLMPGEPSACIAFRYSIRSIDFAGTVDIISSIDSTTRQACAGDDPRIGANLHDGGLRIIEAGSRHGVTYCVQSAARSRRSVIAALADGPTASLERSSTGVRATLRPGVTARIEKFAAYADGEGAFSTAEIDAVCARAEANAAAGFEVHAARRRARAEAQWRVSNIQILGDESSDLVLRFNLFHLLQSASRDPQFSTAAKGLTGEGYEGHAFWDTEAFLVPALVFTAPALARIALQARIARLDDARVNARLLNHSRGALFPWRTISGSECSSHYPSGAAQYHINAAIAQALELYVTATADDTILLEGGAELLWETARVWLDLGTYSPAYDGKFCIFGVTGPDEYSALVDNNYYTNCMAALHLQYAAHVFQEFAHRYPEARQKICSAMGLEPAEVAAWSAAAQAMYLPYDRRLGIDAQDDHFLAKPRLPLQAPADAALLLRLHPMTLYRHQISKQADLVLAMVFAGQSLPLERLRRNLAYYEQVTTHDSSLSACAFAIASSMAGLPEQALDYFRSSVNVDIDDLHGNVAHGSHLASQAGSVMAIQWGFAGLTWRGGALAFWPSLPNEWRGLVLQVLWQGRQIEVDIQQHQTTYRLRQGGALRLRHCGQVLDLDGAVSRPNVPRTGSLA